LSEAKAANESIRFLQELLELTDVMRVPDDLTAESIGSSQVDISTRQIVAQSIKQIEHTLREHPLARARMLTAVGMTAFNIGMVIDARPLMVEAVQLFENVVELQSMEAVKAMVVPARIAAEQRDYESAHLWFKKSRAVLRNLDSEESLAWADICIYETWMGLNWKNGGYVRWQCDNATRAVLIKTKLLGSMHPQTVIARTIATLAGLVT